MNFKYIVAIVRSDAFHALEAKLASLRVGGMTVTTVKGFGEYRNYFVDDWLSEHRKIEIFAEESQVETLCDAILEVAHSDTPGAGIVAVMPVETFLHVRTRSETLSGDCLSESS
jgi:nitrogen regulatory protein P-II 1